MSLPFPSPLALSSYLASGKQILAKRLTVNYRAIESMLGVVKRMKG